MFRESKIPRLRPSLMRTSSRTGPARTLPKKLHTGEYTPFGCAKTLHNAVAGSDLDPEISSRAPIGPFQSDGQQPFHAGVGAEK